MEAETVLHHLAAARALALTLAVGCVPSQPPPMDGDAGGAALCAYATSLLELLLRSGAVPRSSATTG